MIVEEAQIAGLIVVIPRRFQDERGFFAETYSARTYAELGITANFVQDNHSVSSRAGTIRGLHFQTPPHPQAKLVRCGRGAIFDVAVDLRKGSPTYGHWVGAELSAANGRQLFIPAGCAHGFATLLPDSEIIYKCTDFYAPQTEGALRWNDPEIGIEWPIDGQPLVNQKDAEAIFLNGFDSPFAWEG